MEGVAEDREKRARLIEVHGREVGGEIDVRDVGDDLIDHLDELVSHFLAPRHCLLNDRSVHTWKYLVYRRVGARVLDPFFNGHTGVPGSTAMKPKMRNQIDEDSAYYGDQTGSL